MRLPKKFYLKGKQYYSRITTSKGRREWKAVGRTVNEARIGLKDLQAQLLSQKSDRHTYRATIRQGIDAYLEGKKKQLGSPYSFTRYCNHLNNLCYFLQQKYPNLQYLDELEKNHISGFRDYESERVFRNKKISPVTINASLDTLSNMFEWLIDEKNLLEINPAKKIGRLNEPDPDSFYYNEKQMQEIWRVAKQMSKRINWYEVFLTLLHTGMRKKELMYLTWEDIDFKKGIITIRPKQLDNGKLFRVKNRQERAITMTPVLLEALKKMPHKSDKWVFTNSVGKTFSTDTIRKQFRNICKIAGLPIKKLHKTRHTWTSYSFEMGVPAPIIQSQGGWKKVDTMNRYNHSGQNLEYVKREYLDKFKLGGLNEAK